MAQNIIYSLWGGTKIPWFCLVTKLLLFWLLFFTFVFFHFSDLTYFLANFFFIDKRQADNMVCVCVVGGMVLLISGVRGRFSSVQFSSFAQLCPTLCDPMNHSTQGLPVHHKLLEFTQTHAIESVMPSSHLILCCPLLLLPPIPPSIRVISNESTLCIRWPK